MLSDAQGTNGVKYKGIHYARVKTPANTGARERDRQQASELTSAVTALQSTYTR